jgi:biopolymer transport protein ExbB
MRKTFLLMLLLNITTLPGVAFSSQDKPMSLQQLYQNVKQSRQQTAKHDKKREAAFLAEKSKQEQLLKEAKARLTALEKQSAILENQFRENEIQIQQKREQRDKRLGALKELFGHMTSAAGDMQSRFQHAITQVEFPQRVAFLSGLVAKMSHDTQLPSMQEIEQFWLEMLREMVASASVSQFTARVGTRADVPVVRIGLFNLLAEGKYLSYDGDSFDGESGRLSVLPRQPEGAYSSALALQSSTEIQPILIDPTGAAGGGYLKALINTPTLLERWHQGNLVGLIITIVGGFGLLTALWRLLALQLIGAKVSRQLKDKTAKTNNPLGRIINVAEQHPDMDTDNLELKLGEAIVKERPAIEIGLPLLKIIAMISPLLGLLGTVTGMIIVFQSITLFGAGDPKTMAGGISSALVTTVLGLLVAIPMLLIHSTLQAKSRRILHILEEQSLGIIAARTGR